MAAMRDLVADLLAARRPLLGVCLGHEILAVLLGLRLHRRDSPYQGLARDVEIFGQQRRVGFYSSFAAVADADRIDSPCGPVEIARDPADGAVHAMRGTGFAGLQFHPESVLSRDGVAVLAELLPGLLAGVVSPATNG
jgi:phenazine biosynthesis protein phzE